MARIFAIGWVLVGLVITSIFTGVVTTSLTAITLSTDVKLYGTKVGIGFVPESLHVFYFQSSFDFVLRWICAKFLRFISQHEEKKRAFLFRLPR